MKGWDEVTVLIRVSDRISAKKATPNQAEVDAALDGHGSVGFEATNIHQV